ncbi:MAG: GNAT family N-acetyltransferase [Proteobacteria bacterium]|nr:GNAT family N-acetyltransferase [Pseudomonadota bacterium]
MRLETKRLVLRHFNDTDLAEIFKYALDPEFYRYLPVKKQTAETLTAFFGERQKDQLDKVTNRLTFAVAEKESDRIIGSVRLGIFDEEGKKADMGYAMNLSCQGQGLMTEALIRALEYSFLDLSLLEIWAVAHKDNVRSWKLMERLGMRPQASAPLEELVPDPTQDQVIYRLLSKEFQPT